MAAPLMVLKFVKLNPKQETNDTFEERHIKPLSRSGHRIVYMDGCIYAIGGYNPDYWSKYEENSKDGSTYPLFRELWKFNLITREWKELKTTGYMPKELASHSAMLHGCHLVVFGGTGIPFGKAASRRVHVCNLRTLEWKSLQSSGDPPNPVYGHSMSISRDYLYIYGGTSGWEYTSSVHRLSLETREWQHLKIENHDEEPPARYRHESSFDGKKIYIFGGGRSDKNYSFEKIPVFDIETNKWSECKSGQDDVHGFPTARRCHSCVTYEGDVYMCGGYNGKEIYDDVWRFNLKQFQWYKLSVKMPVGAYFHGCTVTDTGCMLIHGGVVKLDVERTSDVYALWLKIPSLKEFAWHLVHQLIPNIETFSLEELLELGIPPHLLYDRITLQSDSGAKHPYKEHKEEGLIPRLAPTLWAWKRFF